MSSTTTRHQALYDSWVSHIDNPAERKAVSRALLDCTPASALISLINSGLSSLDNAGNAFRKKFKITKGAGWLGLEAEASWEQDYCKQLDI
jgi:hypothetical protein